MSDIHIKLNNQLINFIVLSLVLFNLGCSRSSNSDTTIESCLKSYKKYNLENTLKICKKTIEMFPNSPQPLNDRSLIYALNNNNILACKDIQQAMLLVQRKNNAIDPLIAYQMKIRHQNCKK